MVFQNLHTCHMCGTRSLGYVSFWIYVSKKPHIFAFGEYSLDDKNNWIVGLAAQYNLFSGIDKNKNVQAAELQRYASELMTARTKQEIENVIYKSYSEATTAQQSDQLLQQNIKIRPLP